MAAVDVRPNQQTIVHVNYKKRFRAVPMSVVSLSGTISVAGGNVYKDVTISATNGTIDGFDICLVSRDETYTGSTLVKWIAAL